MRPIRGLEFTCRAVLGNSMRLAILVAPSDPRAGDAGSRRMALAWLRGRLARFGFQVVIVGGSTDLACAISSEPSRACRRATACSCT